MTEIQQVVESMLDKVGAIYTPTDNMVASNIGVNIESGSAMRNTCDLWRSEFNF